MSIRKKVEKTFVPQLEQKDCGVACLASITKYFDGDPGFDTLRRLSGATVTGTTMLGLQQAALQTGFEVDGLKGDIAHLADWKDISILHVVINSQVQHFVVFYGFENGRFIIGDPARGVKSMSPEELDQIWSTKLLLSLKPNQQFVRKRQSGRMIRTWFRDLIWPDLNLLGLSIALGLIVSMFSLATAVFLQKLIDEILPDSNREKLVLGLVALLVILLLRSLFEMLRQTFLLRQSVDFNSRIIAWFYTSILRLPKMFFDTRKTGDLVARMNDSVRIQMVISRLVGNVLIDCLMVIISLSYVFVLSRDVGLLLLLSLPINFLIALRFHKIILFSHKEVMSAFATNESNYIDTIQGIETIKIANREGFFAAFTNKIFANFQGKAFSLGKLILKYSVLTEVAGTLLTVAILALMSFMVFSGGFPLGKMMATLSLVVSVIPAAGRLTMANAQFQEARVALIRLFELASTDPEFNYEAVSSDEIGERPIEFQSLEAQNLLFRFPGRSPVIQDASFQVSKGKHVALIGENGAGKSTIFQILEKFYQAESGRITLNGELAWDAVDTPSWRQTLASLPQEVNLFSGHLLFNICLSYEEDAIQRALECCQKYGFDSFFEQFPQSYLTVLGEGGVNISGGQKQMVGLARALYQEPRLLLLDEPTAAMDRDGERFIMTLLEQLKQDMAILTITHKFQTIRAADAIYILENGVVQVHGDHDSLLAFPNLYSRFFEDLIISR